jgi:hypothetical protein
LEKSIYPLRFKWKNRAYKIKKIHFKWDERVGDYKLFHFRVQSDSSDIFELIFDTKKSRWKLAMVELEG